MTNVKIIGTGKYLPDKIIDNEFLSNLVDTNDEWITSRSGISERRISTGQNTSDMAVLAAKKALKDAGIDASVIDLIIVSTISPDAHTPSTACLVQLGISAVNAICFDINAACTGFIYAVENAVQYIKTGRCRTALVISAEVLSKITDWTDRRTCVLFGDGAGAVVLQADDKKAGIRSIYTKADATYWETLKCSGEPLINPFFKEEKEKWGKIEMDGKEVFKFATGAIHECIWKILEMEDLTLDDIAYIVPHQANIRIIEYAAKRNKIDMSKFYTNLDMYGNTSSASIPIALAEMSEKHLLKRGDKIILIGFGGGLTHGAILVEWTR